MLCGKVKLKPAQAKEEASPCTRDLEVTGVAATVPAHDVVSSATSGLTVVAENKIDLADRRTEFQKLDPGEVASFFPVHHGKMARLCHGDQAHRAAA